MPGPEPFLPIATAFLPLSDKISFLLPKEYVMASLEVVALQRIVDPQDQLSSPHCFYTYNTFKYKYTT